MSIREAEIAKHLTRWLDRYAVPLHLRDRPQACQAEAESLAHILCRFAPETDYLPFLNQVFDEVDFQARTRAWPMVGELKAACSNVGKNARVSRHRADEPGTRSIDIVAIKMKRRESVGEAYLWGMGAVELAAERLVDEALMVSYRSAAFNERKAFYGEEAALLWKAEAMSRHEAAKDVYRSRNEAGTLRRMDLPTKSAMPQSGAA